jgi:hypothetical protein
MCQHNKQFDAWWAEQVGNGGTWTILERLAAKDAWEAATKAAHPAPSQPEPGEGAMPPLEHVRGYVQSELWKGSISGASGPIVELAYKFIQGNLQQPQPCPHAELCDYYKKAKIFGDVIEQHQPQPASGAEMPDSADDLTIAYMAGAAAQRDKPGCTICTQGAVRAEYWRKLYAHCPHCGRKLPRIDAKEEGR